MFNGPAILLAQRKTSTTSQSLKNFLHRLSVHLYAQEPPSVFLLSTGYFADRKYENFFHRFSPQHLQTASTPNCSSIPHHNSAPPLPLLISLHAHSVAAIHSFLYNISHTPREISHALPCNSNGKAAATKEMTNKTNLTSKIRKCSH